MATTNTLLILLLCGAFLVIAVGFILALTFGNRLK